MVEIIVTASLFPYDQIMSKLKAHVEAHCTPTSKKAFLLDDALKKVFGLDRFVFALGGRSTTCPPWLPVIVPLRGYVHRARANLALLLLTFSFLVSHLHVHCEV